MTICSGYMGLANHDSLFLSEVQTHRTEKNTDSYFTQTAKWPWNDAFNWGRKERCQHGQIYSEVSYSIYSLVLLDSSWIHRLFQISSLHYTFKMKTEKQSTSLWAFCVFPAEASQSLGSLTSPTPLLCAENDPHPCPCLTELPPTPIVTVMTLDCGDLRVYVASSYALRALALQH